MTNTEFNYSTSRIIQGRREAEEQRPYEYDLDDEGEQIAQPSSIFAKNSPPQEQEEN